MKPFRERNPVTVGAISLAVLVAVLLAAFRADDLPLIGGGDTYYAAFSEAGGLKVGDEVRIAGVRVGDVSEIELDGDQVRVGFKVKTPSRFGTESSASIRVKTLLGDMYLALEPAGSGQLAEDQVIPVERTQAPYDVVDAFQGLANTADKIDTSELAKSMTTLADLTRNTPAEFRAALRGVSALSNTVAKRDKQINTLLKSLSKVTGVLDARDDDLIALMDDADTLFKELVKRRQSISDLLTGTTRLSKELTALIDGSREDLKPALRNLRETVAVLNKNEDNIDDSLRLMAPFYRLFSQTLGNGPWFDTYIQNIPPVPVPG